MDDTDMSAGWARDPLLERLAADARDYLAGAALALEDICLGHPISWAIVRDPAGRRALGTALAPDPEVSGSGIPFPDLPGDWLAWPLAELPARLMADHPLARSLALAVVNAVSQYRLAREDLAGLIVPPAHAGLVRWVVERAPRRLVMIGNMGPVARGLAEAGVPLRVFERNPGNRAGALSDAQEWAWLPEADGLVMSGAVLLNHTLAPILDLARRARFRVLAGFSAQAHPEFLAGSGVSHVFSLHIRDVDRVRRLLQVGNWNGMFETETGYMAPLADSP